MTPAAATFDDLVVPLALGSTYFNPTIESVRKLAYAVDDDSGWLVGDPEQQLVHPQFLSTYMWWPSGFYLREPGAVGHFALFNQLYPHLVGRPFLHAKSAGRFHAPFRLGAPIRADVTVVEKYRKRGRDFIIMRAAFHDADNRPLATYHHTCAIRSDSIKRGGDAPPPRPETTPAPPPGATLAPRRIELSLEKSRLFSLPAENYHTHDKHAQAMGLRVAVPAAMMSFAYLSRFAQDHFGDAWISQGELDVVFTRMMARDDVLTVQGSAHAAPASETKSVLDLRIDNAQREPVAVATATMLRLAPITGDAVGKRALAKRTSKVPAARQGIQSIEIGAILLGVLSDATGPLALKDLAARAGMSASKAHKYLVSLARVGLTQQHPISGHYDLGPIALKMGLAALNRRDVVRYATEAAIELNLHHDLTVMVTIWTPRGPIVISLYNSSALVVGNVSVGSILPVLRSASGRVFLAYLPRRMTDRIVRRELAQSGAKRTGFELRTMADVEGLIAKVFSLRAGWTKDDLVVGLNAIAAPIFDHQGVIVASLTILDNTDTVELGSRKSMLGELRRVSDEVSHKLGFWETKVGKSFAERRASA